MTKVRKRGGRPRLAPIRDGEKVTFSVRVTPDLRAKLDAAAARGGRSLTQEAEHRLELSFFVESLAEPVADAVAQRLRNKP